MKKMKFLFTFTCVRVHLILCIMLCAHPGTCTQVARSTYVYYVVVLSLRVYTKDK